ncbi:MAG: GNAT family N-acetyltransferase [Rhodothermales bacterium]|nr:GNAT family N-acetyltransferase [Rhodothermales bacterium]
MGDPAFAVRAVSGESDWEAARSIRTVVFIEEQQCTPSEEWDGLDDTSRHLLGWLGNTPIGVARWRTVSHEGRVVAKLERFAILKEYRGRGFGRELVVRTMNDALLAGFSDYIVHAQTYLADLYADLGFERIGETFVEADLPHVRMVFRGAGAAS